MEQKRLLCLDFDNTIVLSDRAHIDAYNQSFAKNGLPTVSSSALKKQFGKVGEKVVKSVFPHISRHRIHRVLEDHHHFLRTGTVKHLRVVPGVRNALRQLKRKYFIALITNCGKKVLNTLMREANIQIEDFTLCITRDDVRHPKPAPDGIFKAEKLLQRKATYMVGDSIYDMRAGKKAKAKTIAVLTGNHTRKMLAREKPLKIIKSIKELPNII